MASYDYTQEFRTALSRSSELGLNVPQVAFQTTRFYSDDKFMSLINQLYRKLGNSDGTVDLVGQCLNVHWNIRGAAESVFKCGAHLTIGYIQENEDLYFEFSYQNVKDWLTNGIDLNKVSLHAWITLDSMEIVDLTWPSTRAKILKSQQGWGTAVTKHPDEFVNGLQYHPLVINNDFPNKIKAVQGFILTIPS